MCVFACPWEPQLNYSDTLSLSSERMGGWEAYFSHPLYGRAQRYGPAGAAGVQEAVACCCLITAETTRSAAGQDPAGSGALPASCTCTQKSSYRCSGLNFPSGSDLFRLTSMQKWGLSANTFTRVVSLLCKRAWKEI